MKTYTFHVSLPGFGRVWRKIEMEAGDTLESLHFAIQHAFSFDGDHLYSFFMSGRAWDESTEYTLPEGVDPYGFDLDHVKDEEEDEEDGELDLAEEEWPPVREVTAEEAEQILAVLHDESLTPEEKRERLGPVWDLIIDAILTRLGPGDVRATTLESLNLERGRKFLYLFDFGDEWRFQVRVHAINPDAPAGEYPRVVESVGEAPVQYGTWDGEEADEEDG